MEAREPRQRPPKARSAGPLAMALILGVVGLVTLLYLATGAHKAKAAQQEEEKVEEVDPFADLPPEVPKERQKHKPH